MLRVGFPLIGKKGWIGGFVHQVNILRAINSRLSHEIDPWVFVSPAEHEEFGAELEELLPGRIVVHSVMENAGRGQSLLRALITGRNKQLEKLLDDTGIDVMFEVANFYGMRFRVPVIALFADFQHRSMPGMFARSNWWRRELGFRTQIASGRTLMVSSQTACDDMERFYPSTKGRVHLARLAIDLDITPYFTRGRDVRAKYALPEQYYYLPNQFWKHKNHEVVVRALIKLNERGALKTVPPIILSGKPGDPRAPGIFEALFHLANEAGVQDWFRYLGVIPYQDVLALNADCKALINPSLFEGLSLSIQEAKAFGTPMILSDLPIHREQAPDAWFFDVSSSNALADVFLALSNSQGDKREPTKILVQKQNQRIDQHAEDLQALFRAAVGDRRTGG